MENKTREAIRFEGSVQGVGFRYRMSQLARHYDVTGWVRNEYDGSVSAELQGRREAIDEIIARLREDSYIYLMEPEYIKKRRLPKKRHKKIKRSRYIR